MNESPRTIRHTVRVATEMHRFGDGVKMNEPQGYKVEFFKRGEHIETRSYSYSEQDEALMATRISEWVRLGHLPNWAPCDNRECGMYGVNHKHPITR
jgi:hypothetical protein